MDKPFKTYDQLIVKLRDEKNLSIDACDEEKVIRLLKKYSYFSLISGYKDLFKKSDGMYFDGTTIDDIFALYQFDDCLRDTFFHAIQIVEKNIKSLLSYSFVSKYGEDQSAYLDPRNYDPQENGVNNQRRKKEIKKLISTFISVVAPPSEHNYIEHQWEKHRNVPLWATMKAITFGNMSKMYSLSIPGVQSLITKEFDGVTEYALVGMLDMLSRVRNVCAHSERLYNFTVKEKRAIQDMPIHASLNISKEKSGVYRKGKRDLFAALIALKYLLDKEDFRQVVKNIETALAKLSKETKKIPPNKMLSCMGFPENWKEIAK